MRRIRVITAAVVAACVMLGGCRNRDPEPEPIPDPQVGAGVFNQATGVEVVWFR